MDGIENVFPVLFIVGIIVMMYGAVSIGKIGFIFLGGIIIILSIIFLIYMTKADSTKNG